MDNYGLDLHSQMLLDEYRLCKPVYTKLQQVVKDVLTELLKSNGIVVGSFEDRIKAEESLAGKLQRKGSKYGSLSDITDIYGARIIAFYNEDVDRIASLVEKSFDVDWDNSVDKRRMHQFDSFGYNSLHYICRLLASLCSDPQLPQLNELRFELQMRTALQHVWSAIQHDIGYKTSIETPMEYHRALSRLAGLLELADNEFSRIRAAITDYRRRAMMLMASGKLDQVPLDGDTFRTYLDGAPFDELNARIAAVNQAEIQPMPLLNYLPVLKDLGMTTLADVEQMKKEYSDAAYQLALAQLSNTDLDILSSASGLQNLCMVQILKEGGGRPGLRRMFDTVNGKSEHHDLMAQAICDEAARLSFMKDERKSEKTVPSVSFSV